MNSHVNVKIVCEVALNQEQDIYFNNKRAYHKKDNELQKWKGFIWASNAVYVTGHILLRACNVQC